MAAGAAAAVGAATGGWGYVAMGAISLVGSLLGGSRKKYTYKPNETWLSMREDVMKGIQEGLEAGGYTWSEEMGDNLFRTAKEDIARDYAGAEESVREVTAPYGAIGALGRGVTDVNIAKAQETSRAGRDLDVARETQKLNSYSNLLQQGGQIGDPNLPGAQLEVGANAGYQTPMQNLGRGIETGIATGMNFYQADKDRNFYQNWLTSMGSRNKGVDAISNLTANRPSFNSNSNIKWNPSWIK